MYICFRCGERYDRSYRDYCFCGEPFSIINIPNREYEVMQNERKTKSAASLIKENTNYERLSGFEFLGDLAKKFIMMVHGEPGSGKSTFCLLLANRFALNGKRTLYVSGEEGFSDTFRKKLVDWEIDSPMLLVTTKFTSDGVKGEIIKFKPFCVVIDSITAINFTAEDVRVMDALIRGPVVYILHSTKDHKYKGETDFGYLTDINVRVDEGVAETIKNRFGPIGQEFSVFEYTISQLCSTEKEERPDGVTSENFRE